MTALSSAELKKAEWRKLGPEHAAEQEKIGLTRAPSGWAGVVEIDRCYTVDGDPQIWLPGEDVIYFVVDFAVVGTGGLRSWVNRLRCNGWAQLRDFVNVAWPDQQVTGATIDKIIGDAQPLNGVHLHLRTDPPNPKGYIHHRWSPV